MYVEDNNYIIGNSLMLFFKLVIFRNIYQNMIAKVQRQVTKKYEIFEVDMNILLHFYLNSMNVI